MCISFFYVLCNYNAWSKKHTIHFYGWVQLVTKFRAFCVI